MYIYQIERELLHHAITVFSCHLTGVVLDAGAGASRRYQSLLTNASEYVALDCDPDAKPDLLGSVTSIPAQDDSFDSVLCTQVIGDVPYPYEAVRELYRVLKPGGTVLLTEGFLNELHSQPRDYWRFTPYGLRTLFSDAGFEVKHTQLIGGPFSVIRQIKTRLLIRRLVLYKRPLLGRVFSMYFRICSSAALFLDRVVGEGDDSFGLNVLIVAKKP